MNKILILNDFLNINYKNLPNFLKKLLNYYKNSKLDSLVKSLEKKYSNITVINSSSEIFENDDFLTDFRISLSRTKYLTLKNKIIKSTNQNLRNLNRNAANLKLFHINGILIPNLIEVELVYFLDAYFGKYELLREIIQKGNYERIILINCQPVLKSIFRDFCIKYGNIEICNDKFLVKSNATFKWLDVSIYLVNLFGSFLKRKLLKRSKNQAALTNKDRVNILFTADTKNQFLSIKPVYEFLKKNENINKIFYKHEYFFSLFSFTNLMRFLFQSRRVLIDYQDKVVKDMKYESTYLKNALKIYYDSRLLLSLIDIFNIKNNLSKRFNNYNPALVVIPTEYSKAGRLTASFSKLKNIPTIYIPHSPKSFMDEMVNKNIFDFVTVSGQSDKDYFVANGTTREKIIVTGRPRYDNFYKGKIKKLTVVKDMFDDRLYKFDSDKFTILLTSNPIGEKTLKTLISIVVESVKDLNLLDNLIIKLHPRENGIFHKKLLQKLNANPVIVRDYNIFELIKASNLLISLSRLSSTLLEAMIIGKPFIALDIINLDFVFTNRIPYMENNFLFIVKDQKDLTEKIKKLARDKDFYTEYSEDLKELSKRYSYYDEKESSTEKVANLIVKLLENKKKY